MKWVNPPVVLMLHAGAPRLAAAGVDIPGLRSGDLRRVALEAYPGLFAREVLGRRSYKSDDRRRDDDGRRGARAMLATAVERGSTRLGLPVRIDAAARRWLVADHSADALDAVICAVQAAWAWERRAANYGIPPDVDPCEGWIVTAIEAATVADPGGAPMIVAPPGAPQAIEPLAAPMLAAPSGAPAVEPAVEPDEAPLPSAARRGLVR
jgi:hypothetical protein